MVKFAEFSPQIKSKKHPKDLLVRFALLKDARGIARIKFERSGTDPKKLLRQTKKQILKAENNDNFKVFSAVIKDKVVGFGSLMYFDSKKTKVPFVSPSGWYCTGVIVKEEFRRRNIARGIFKTFFAWLQGKTDCVYSFVSAQNRASINLHNKLKFKECRRASGFLKVKFDCGQGVLFKKSL
jgi:RimJ/RimL family protein N-acetyltransferase